MYTLHRFIYCSQCAETFLVPSPHPPALYLRESKEPDSPEREENHQSQSGCRLHLPNSRGRHS